MRLVLAVIVGFVFTMIGGYRFEQTHIIAQERIANTTSGGKLAFIAQTSEVWMTIHPRDGDAFGAQSPQKVVIYAAAPDDMDVCFGKAEKACVSLGHLRRMLEVQR